MPLGKVNLDDGTAVGGAPQWVAGPQKEGALVYDDGVTYRVKQDIANSQSAPGGNPGFYDLVGPELNADQLAALAVGDASADNQFATVGQLRERLFLSGYDTSTAARNKAIDPATGNIISQTGSRLLLDTPVEASTVYELNTISDLQGVYGYLSNSTGGFKFLSTLMNVPQAPGESLIFSASPALPLDSQDNVLRFRGSLSAGQPSDLYIYRTDRYAGTGGAGGTPRDPYDVDTAKRKEVVDANVPAYLEADTDYYGKSFVDEVYGPGRPAMYWCRPSAPATSGGATAWKWFRTDIL